MDLEAILVILDVVLDVEIVLDIEVIKIVDSMVSSLLYTCIAQSIVSLIWIKTG